MSYLWGFITVVDGMAVINFDAIRLLLKVNEIPLTIIFIVVSVLTLKGAISYIRKNKKD